jgi:hypothetical protein
MNHTQHELATQFWMRYFWNSTDSPEKSDFFNFCESLCEATNRNVGSEATDGVLPVMCSASVSKYLIVSVNEDGEHEIIFVTSSYKELMRRWVAFAGSGAIYTVSEHCT